MTEAGKCLFSETDKDKLSKLSYMAEDIRATLADVADRFKSNVSNTEISKAIFELQNKFEEFTASALSLKMNALSISINDMDAEISKVDSKLKQILQFMTECSSCQDTIGSVCGNTEEIKTAVSNIEKSTIKPKFERWQDSIGVWIKKRSFIEVLIILLIILTLAGKGDDFMDLISSKKVATNVSKAAKVVGR